MAGFDIESHVNSCNNDSMTDRWGSLKITEGFSRRPLPHIVRLFWNRLLLIFKTKPWLKICRSSENF
jgi:hypothetical protein